MRFLIRVARWLFFLTMIITLLGVCFLVWLSVTDFKPPPSQPLEIKNNTSTPIKPGTEICLLSWNIGYAGLDRDMDFFFDGGQQVRQSLENYQRSLNGVFNTLSSADTNDIILLQEVDFSAKRSYLTDQFSLFSKCFPDFSAVFALNYRVPMIPFPLLQPLGKVSAGLMSLHRFQLRQASRLASPRNFEWPKRLFFPDRCFSLLHFPLVGGKELLIINLHNSAWEDGALLRQNELYRLKDLIMREYQKGNFVIAGGDWNQPPPAYDFRPFASGDAGRKDIAPIEPGFMPKGWTWAYDPLYPTNRDLDQAYRKGKTPCNIFDYFLLSPNIRLSEVRTISQDFAFSDHNPVYLRVSLLPDSSLIPASPAR